MEHEVEVIVDGKSLPMTPFVANIVEATVAAMIRTLKGGENAKEIKVRITGK
jgi:hypothetical protein